jgi:hypothetical protein
MSPAQVNTFGGVSGLLALVSVAWSLVDRARYRGDLERMRAWLQARKGAAVATVRRLLRRPSRSVVVQAPAAGAIAAAGTVTVVARRSFTPRPGQPLEEQIAELGALVNRLQEDLIRQGQEHREAVDALREQMDAALQAEQQRADAAISVVRGDLQQLRETTTGGLRLEIDSALGVLIGGVFTT